MSRGQIESHKDFKSLSGMVAREHKSATLRKVLIIVITLVCIVAMGLTGYYRLQKESKEKPNEENVDQMIFDEFK